jgi:hypothetical protein
MLILECTQGCDGRTDGRKDGRKDGRTEGWTDGSVTISLRNFVGEGITKVLFPQAYATLADFGYPV